MTNSQRLANVRAHLQRWLSENGGAVDPDSPGADAAGIVSESILIRDGFYAGRTFVGQNHRATWFMEPDELKIHGSDGAVVAVFRGDEIVAAEDLSESQVVVVEDGTPPPVDAPISIPMRAADDRDGADDAADDQDQLPKAA
ncbi:hypothetical protein FYK55_21830 [Roseiconus nitratireducens]|uniref:Uncharacterized protein n=1 Tax=Roseiconus nitratireducens TaxID=2605748 RepID=A0A5M6D3G7_9BACT|nr:hypothetical protein [Roseiconus nitratireducens]KAA5540269.1 hypothetical protein FYK55_21830 [Roseiconus nitratireducens]